MNLEREWRLVRGVEREKLLVGGLRQGDVRCGCLEQIQRVRHRIRARLGHLLENHPAQKNPSAPTRLLLLCAALLLTDRPTIGRDVRLARGLRGRRPRLRCPPRLRIL